MAAENKDWEEFPTYWDLCNGIGDFLVEMYRELFIEKREPHPIEVTWRYFNFTIYDISLVILFSVVWTILRHFATERVFKPLGRYYALTPTNMQKMPESAWKFTFYLCAWSSCLYVVILSGNYKFFQKPSTLLDGWILDAPPPTDLYLLYLCQCGFYIHSLYATVWLDTWRKDSLVNMIHHVLTLILIGGSHSLRYHKGGSLAMLTHDVCDILLEFAKLNVYFKIQGGREVKRHEFFANISFAFFTLVWCVGRLYVYPLRVVYNAIYFVLELKMILPGRLLINSLLLSLLALNLYWFLFILQFFYRVATGQVRTFDDPREYDVEEKFRLSSTNSSSFENGLANGVKMNGSCDEVPLSNEELSPRRRKED